MSELAGYAAIVTGSAHGIGAAVARALRDAGARVCGVDLDRSEDVDLAVRADVADPAGCARAVGEAVEAFGRLDILVNSAGIQRYGSVVDTPEDVWDRVLGVNLTSMFLMGKHAVPHLIESARGAVVNVASVQAFAAQRGVAAYAASKGGAVALTRAMAVDHAPSVRVNCICPGSVDTPMLRGAAELFGEGDPDGTLAAWGQMHPLGRVASADEVAQAVLFLAGPRASFVTGSALRVDGGLLSVIAGT